MHLDASQLLSPAQLLGYLAFVLGVSAFLQTNDRRLKVLLASECVAYAAHFALLGNPTAASSAAVSFTRVLLSLRTRSRRLAVVVIAVYLGLGAVLVRSPAGWLPVVGSSISTWALFTMHGIRMRLLVLTSTLLWLANNLLSGSIGGTLLEGVIAVASISTIARMVRDARRDAPALQAGDPGAP